ncbi:MAG: hypothetical protein DDT27_00760 [Dehalococcoidia bacterium]|nr:hypothetical protein [Chloroflexota bacterium]
MDLYQHMFLELPRLDPESGGADEVNKTLDQDLCLLGWGSFSEAGAASFPGISKQGELTHHQNLALYIQCGEVELARFIREYAQAGGFLRHVASIGFGIANFYPDKGNQARPDLTDDLPIDTH